MVFVLGILALTGMIVYASYVQVFEIDRETRKEIVEDVKSDN
jgi:hypothetical protein